MCSVFIRSSIPKWCASLCLGSVDGPTVGMGGTLCSEMGWEVFLLGGEDQNYNILIRWCFVVIKSCNLHVLCIFQSAFRSITSLILSETCDVLMTYVPLPFLHMMRLKLRHWVIEYQVWDLNPSSWFFYFMHPDYCFLSGHN